VERHLLELLSKQQLIGLLAKREELISSLKLLLEEKNRLILLLHQRLQQEETLVSMLEELNALQGEQLEIPLFSKN